MHKNPQSTCAQNTKTYVLPQIETDKTITVWCYVALALPLAHLQQTNCWVIDGVHPCLLLRFECEVQAGEVINGM